MLRMRSTGFLVKGVSIFAMSRHLWPIVDAIRPSFTAIDEFAEKRGKHGHLVYMDRLLGRLRGRNVFFPFGALTDA